MTPFKSPNHTQTPNDLFDEYLPLMGEAELKVVLALIRETLGFHRRKAKMSLTQLQKATGMSRQGVLNGAENAVKRGLINRKSARNGTSWVVNVLDHPPQEKEPEVVNVVDQGSQRSRPIQSGLKKVLNKKESSPNGDPGKKNGKPPSTYIQDMEYLEEVFVKTRNCPPPDWATAPAEAQKRWRTPLAEMRKKAGAVELAARGVEEVTARMRAAEMTFDAPDQILKSFGSWLIDHRDKGAALIKNHQDGGIE